MKNIISTIKGISVALSVLLLSACVHDDKYDAPTEQNYQCNDLSKDTSLSLISLEEVKSRYSIGAAEAYVFPSDSNLYIEGYVSSSDKSGNIYKTIYIQDKPENPTQGFAISVEATSTYTNYPQGAKIYVKLAGLAIGEYGRAMQLGVKVGNESFANAVTRIPEKDLATTIFRSCSEKATIVPKVMTLREMSTINDQYLGCLIKVQNVEFAAKHLCSQYAPAGTNADRQIIDPTNSTTTRVVRNSGYASFATKTIPSGNGDLVGVLSKFNSTYQIYIVNDTDLNMNGARIDGISAPCQPDANAVAKTVADIKNLLNGRLTQITENATLTAKVTANDEAGNLYKYIYIEDHTGGIRVNINALNLYQDRRFQVGRTLTINLKDLYVGQRNGEIQLGGLFNGMVGQVEENNMHKHFYKTEIAITNINPTEKNIASLTTEDIGKYVKIKDVQFIDTDLGKTYADGNSTTTRTLEDCSGNKITLATNGRANFGNRFYPLVASDIEVNTGKGDLTGILSYYNGQYQIILLNLRGAVLTNPRCDGSLPIKSETIFKDGFENLNNWSTHNIEGVEVWSTANFGNPRPSAFFDGRRNANTDWLVSPEISLTDFKEAFVSFETDGRYSGSPLEFYITENYTGDASTTNWTRLNATFDTDLNAYAGFVSSGNIDLTAYSSKKIRLAFKYASTAGASTSWEIDNFLVKGVKK